ncbi:MAG: peptidase, partial [Thermoguttaceae bacterium]
MRHPQQALLALAILGLAAPALLAQNQSTPPHIGYVYPTGGQRGTSLEVTVGGQFIKDTGEVYLSGSGVQVEVVRHYQPLTQGEYSGLNRMLDEAREKLVADGKKEPVPLDEVAKAAGITPEQLKEMDVYRKRDADPKRQPNNQIIEELTLKITIAKDAAMGKRELRVITPVGMSNPVWFFVDQWDERKETEPNDEKPDPVAASTLPVVLNGQVMPGDVDRFALTLRKGTRLVINTAARDLMPYLADAVPGWFQAVVVLYDPAGNRLAYAGDYYYRQDPVIYCEIPADGQYVCEIRDSIYRGREDFVYRITLGQLPFVTGIFPLGGRAGADVAVKLQGWNLVETDLNVRASFNRNRPIRWYSIAQGDAVDIRFPLRIDMTTEVLDVEPNDTPETAQQVAVPTIVNGRIDKPDDQDLFRFEGHGRLEIEVFGRRGGSPVDSALALTDADGKEIGFNDDYKDEAEPLITHHADSLLSVDLVGRGPYCLHLSDAQRKGGGDFIYRLYIRRPQPDFELRVVPSSIIARPGAHVPITVHALRRGQYDDDIELSLVEPPAGFVLTGAKVPRGEGKVQLTLAVPPEAPVEHVILEMDGLSPGSHRQRRFTRPVIHAEN